MLCLNKKIEVFLVVFFIRAKLDIFLLFILRLWIVTNPNYFDLISIDKVSQGSIKKF